MRWRVVLVDDHGLFLAGVRSELGDSVEVVGEAGTVADAVPLIKQLDPHVVLLDVHLPDGKGDAIINAVAPERPGVKFLALSVSDAAEDVIAVIRAGARGYVTKTIAADVEELHGIRIELASAGDALPDSAIVLAAREAMTNAAKFAGVDEIDVYADVAEDEIAVFVRDRGAGFDPASVPEDRQGIRESIKSRLERAGGTAVITSAPGEGTEVELRLPR